MKKSGTLITGCCAAFALALTVVSHLAARKETHELRNLNESISRTAISNATTSTWLVICGICAAICGAELA